MSPFLSVTLPSLSDIKSLLEIVGLISWPIYIILTILTFRQIKQQTDLQHDAFLVVSFKFVDDTQYSPEQEEYIHDICKSAYTKWRGIVDKHIRSPGNTKYLVLTLTNRGKSDITDWTINIRSCISPLGYLASKYNITGEEISWVVSSRGSQDIISPQEEIRRPVAITGAFPQVDFSWEITYNDLRGKEYSKFAGDREANDKNAFADPAYSDEQAAIAATQLKDEYGTPKP